MICGGVFAGAPIPCQRGEYRFVPIRGLTYRIAAKQFQFPRWMTLPADQGIVCSADADERASCQEIGGIGGGRLWS